MKVFVFMKSTSMMINNIVEQIKRYKEGIISGETKEKCKNASGTFSFFFQKGTGSVPSKEKLRLEMELSEEETLENLLLRACEMLLWGAPS